MASPNAIAVVRVRCPASHFGRRVAASAAPAYGLTMTTSWKEQLQGAIPDDWAREIDHFEAQMMLRKQGKIEEKVFAETRLRRGTYGQRYDNGRRHDGITQQTLPYSPLTKGPDTMWDAPGMLRIKIPFGGLNPEQMRLLADLAEEYSDAI